LALCRWRRVSLLLFFCLVATPPPEFYTFPTRRSSDLCALVYEVVWSRQFGLLFGHTAQAAAVVLGAYFGGMTVGYLLAARLAGRSEEHTSELQSRENLVCRLLLEKKKNKDRTRDERVS